MMEEKVINKSNPKTKNSSTKTGTRSSTKPKRNPKQTTTKQPSSQAYLSDDSDIQFTMTHAMDHDDGSATYNLDLNQHTTGKLIEIGVIALLKQHIEQERAKKLTILQRLKRLFKK